MMGWIAGNLIKFDSSLLSIEILQNSTCCWTGVLQSTVSDFRRESECETRAELVSTNRASINPRAPLSPSIYLSYPCCRDGWAPKMEIT